LIAQIIARTMNGNDVQFRNNNEQFKEIENALNVYQPFAATSTNRT
jgi:hypothetical protein